MALKPAGRAGGGMSQGALPRAATAHLPAPGLLGAGSSSRLLGNPMPASRVELPRPSPKPRAPITCSHRDAHLPAHPKGPIARQLGSLHLDGRKSPGENLSRRHWRPLHPGLSFSSANGNLSLQSCCSWASSQDRTLSHLFRTGKGDRPGGLGGLPATPGRSRLPW